MKRRAGGGDPGVGGGDGVLLEIRKMETPTHNTDQQQQLRLTQKQKWRGEKEVKLMVCSVDGGEAEFRCWWWWREKDSRGE